MPIYRNADTLYKVLQTTFARIEQKSPGQLDGLHTLMSSKMVLRLRCTEPRAEITLNGREKKFRAAFGPSDLRADLTVELSSDTLHQVLLNELAIKQAYASGLIKVQGPVWKLKVLSDLAHGARQYYPDVVRRRKLTA